MFLSMTGFIDAAKMSERNDVFARPLFEAGHTHCKVLLNVI